jgi:hypothetical protein
VILLPQEIEAEAAKARGTPAGTAQPLPQAPVTR